MAQLRRAAPHARHPGRRLALVPALAALLLGGCATWHLGWDAPGAVDLKAKPSAAVERTEVPEDPGEHVVLASWGALLMWGGQTPGTDEAPLGFAVAPELTISYHDRKVSHLEDDHLDLYLPETSSHGANIGWAVLAPGPGRGPLYAEYQYRSGGGALAWGIAGGWAARLEEGQQGPQLTAFGLGGALVARATYLIGAGLGLQLGVAIKLPLAMVWSR